MMKRVCKTRVGACAMLLAVFLLVGGVGAPAFARVEMTCALAGDPGDGLDRDGGGRGCETPTGGDSATTQSSATRSTVFPEAQFILIPVYGASGLHFLVVFNFAQLAVTLK